MNFSASVEIRAVYPTHSNRAALRAACYLWVADPRQVTFLCAAEEKSPKETPPRMAQPNPALLRLCGPRRSYEASCLEDQARTSCPRPLRGALPKPCGARVCAIRGPEKPHISGLCFRCLRCSVSPSLGYDSS